MQDTQHDINLTFKKGDTSAFDRLYAQLSNQLIFYCKTFVGFEDAQDIVAETFYKLWKARGNWSDIHSVRSFLFVSARNSCLNLIKHQKIKSEKQKMIAELMANQHKAVLFSEIESELISQIMTEIESLPDNAKAVFKMSYLEGYKTEEIAEKLDITVKTAYNLKSIALKSIRTSIFKTGLKVNVAAIMMEIARFL